MDSTSAVLLEIPFQSSDLLPEVIGGFQSFLALPQAHKNRFTIDFSRNGDPDDGYVRKDLDDKKEFFHFCRGTFDIIQSRGLMTMALRGWLANCQTLFFRCEEVLLQHIEIFEAKTGGDLKKLLKEASLRHTLRLLWYEETQTEGQVIGKPHTDRDFLTLHVAESEPGLQFFPFTETAVVGENKAIIFPGQKMEKLTEGKVKAVQHRALGTTEGHARWGVVFFGHINLQLP